MSRGRIASLAGARLVFRSLRPGGDLEGHGPDTNGQGRHAASRLHVHLRPRPPRRRELRPQVPHRPGPGRVHQQLHPRARKRHARRHPAVRSLPGPRDRDREESQGSPRRGHPLPQHGRHRGQSVHRERRLLAQSISGAVPRRRLQPHHAGSTQPGYQVVQPVSRVVGLANGAAVGIRLRLPGSAQLRRHGQEQRRHVPHHCWQQI